MEVLYSLLLVAVFIAGVSLGHNVGTKDAAEKATQIVMRFSTRNLLDWRNGYDTGFSDGVQAIREKK